MMFLVQCIDDTGRTIDDDVTGFPMTRDGAETMCRFFNGLGYAAVSRWVVASMQAELYGWVVPAIAAMWAGLSYIVVPVEGGEE